MKTLSFVIVGTGLMAANHAKRLSSFPSVRLVAAVDVNEERVGDFCQEFKIEHAYTDLKQALSNHALDAATIVTPDAWHASTSIECLQAGLDVLCEKPLSDSVSSCKEMVESADASGAINMVNLTYRTSGALFTARQLIDSGEIGEVRHVEASYRQSWLCSPYWGDWRAEDSWLWRLSTAHGSAGVLGDIGIHLIDFITAGVGHDITSLQCRLKTFDKAEGNRIGEYELDANDSCVVSFELHNGALGVAHMSRFQSGYHNDLFLTIHGTTGALRVSTGNEGDFLHVCQGEDLHIPAWKAVTCGMQADTFERFVDACQSRSQGSPDFAHAAKLQQVLDTCFASHDQGLWLKCV